MPRYDYQCDTCEYVEEIVADWENKPIGRLCKNCGQINFARAMKPIISRVRIGHIDSGRLQSVAFGKEFKNEKDMLHYAKHHGYEPLENASLESVQKSFTDYNKIKEDERLKNLSEGIEWNQI